MNNRQRELLANGFKDLSNLLVVGLVVGQAFITEKDLVMLIIGFIAYLVLNVLAILLLGGKTNA